MVKIQKLLNNLRQKYNKYSINNFYSVHNFVYVLIEKFYTNLNNVLNNVLHCIFNLKFFYV